MIPLGLKVEHEHETCDGSRSMFRSPQHKTYSELVSRLGLTLEFSAKNFTMPKESEKALMARFAAPKITQGM